jgi:hypothetical protein
MCKDYVSRGLCADGRWRLREDRDQEVHGEAGGGLAASARESSKAQYKFTEAPSLGTGVVR